MADSGALTYNSKMNDEGGGYKKNDDSVEESPF